MFGSLARKMFGTTNERIIRQYHGRVAAINALEPHIAGLSDEALKAKTAEFRLRLQNGEALDKILPDAFAVVREAAKRTLGMRHFDVQLIGGMVLHEGRIAEMKTGEGKTLVATLPVYLNAIEGKGVHVVTVNDYLAQRDAEWMGHIYRFLGLTVGIITHDLDDDERQAAYGADITYGTNNEYGFDYLRDNMKYSREAMVQRPFNFAVVDEVDSILIDEARTPLIISGPTEDNSELYVKIDRLIPKLRKEHYEVDEKTKAVALNDDGIIMMEESLIQAGMMTDGESLYDIGNVSLVHHVNQALRAHTLFTRDVDYIVKDDKVVIIDEFTGRMMEGRRYSDGLHQALEAKEKVSIQNENQTLASITFQNYFRLYPKLAGMTGTAMTEAAEFSDIYRLESVEIPPNVPVARLDYDDEIYRTMKEKYGAVIELVKQCHAKQQPVLVGTVSIEKSELLSKLLKAEKIPHNVLNARHHEKEAHIIAQAGQPGAVTIATNMAGRGTDIVLGGNISQEIAAIEANAELTESQKQQQIEALRSQWQKDHEEVKALGGLRIIATERHESRRIDNQLRGRSGRQGDPGSSRFYLSLDDQLMRIFAGDRVRAIMDRLKMPEGEAIEAGMVTRSIESAQRKVEGRNFDVRKQLLEYDDVANEQRKVIYEQRNAILDTPDLTGLIKKMIAGCAEDLVRQYVPEESMEEQWALPALEKALGEWHLQLNLQEQVAKNESITDEDILELVQKAAIAQYESKLDLAGSEQFMHFQRAVMLQSFDTNWRDHLAALDYLRQGIHLRGFAQKQPKQEYKREAFELFSQLIDVVKNEVTRVLLTVRIREPEALQQAADSIEDRAGHIPGMQYASADGDKSDTPADDELPPLPAGVRVGRNDPCPCGSGKKYKQCHGKLS